jgi:DNA polymerase III gamma/tau subunit
MVKRLRTIADAQHTPIDEEALITISNLSDGALRDAISLLDQVSTGMTRRITRDDVLKITGVVDDAFLSSMANALLSGDSLAIVTLTEELVMDGRDIIRFTLDLARYFRSYGGRRIAESRESRTGDFRFRREMRASCGSYILRYPYLCDHPPFGSRIRAQMVAGYADLL